MRFQYFPLVSTFILSAVAAIPSTTLCLKGCCGLQLDLPTNQLSFSNPAAKDQKPVISINHLDTGIQCCDCDDVPAMADTTNATIALDANLVSSKETTAQISLHEALAAQTCLCPCPGDGVGGNCFIPGSICACPSGSAETGEQDVTIGKPQSESGQPQSAGAQPQSASGNPSSIQPADTQKPMQTQAVQQQVVQQPINQCMQWFTGNGCEAGCLVPCDSSLLKDYTSSSTELTSPPASTDKSEL